MTIRWKRLLVKTSAWLTAEVCLNLVGLDNLADYGEFMLQEKAVAQAAATVVHLMALVS
jgi:hypothetical protein